ncbi:MAG: NAD(P)H-binding protein [Oscillospiraceae bacterium]|nr:NAD(P)H-binding protein [Oscillospiraceae bacterium]
MVFHMKIGIIAASGKAGKLIAAEALSRGMDVTAIVRDKRKIDTDAYAVIEKDIFDITVEDVDDFEAVVSAFGSDPGMEDTLQTSLKHLTSVFEELPAVRLLIIGGAASLYLDIDRERQLIETIPPEWIAVPASMLIAYNELQKSKANWTFFSPAGFFDPDGPRTGRYTLGTDYAIYNSAGESYISYADYAVAMVDEIEKKNFIGRRFTAVSERS